MCSTVFSLLIGYFLGCLNPALLISKRKHIKIRAVGTGNPGATNMFLSVGKRAGIFVMLFDIIKAIAATGIAQMLFFDNQYAGVIAGMAAIIGHMFPVFVEFKGGKGTACIGGVIIALDWRLFLPMLLLSAAVALLLDHASAAPCAAAVIYPIVCAVNEKDIYFFFILLPACALMLYRHRENIRRIFDKTEPRISEFLKHHE